VANLTPMATKAREAMDAEDLTVIADADYFKRTDILSCHEAGITANVPHSPNLGNRAKTSFGRKDFHYAPEKDEYRCPANERLIWRMTSEEDGLMLHRYWCTHCEACALKSQCTTDKERLSSVGNMRQSLRPCKIDWIAIRRSCGYVDKQWNTRTGR
jgi:hypothetical protein